MLLRLTAGLLAAIGAFATPLAAQESGGEGYLDRLVGRDFVACLPAAGEICPDGGLIPVGVRVTEKGRVLFKMYGTEYVRAKGIRAPLYDFELYRDPEGLHMMAAMLVREKDAIETANSIEFAYRNRRVEIFERDGHPVLRETKNDGSKVFYEVNLMAPDLAAPSLASKFLAMREKYGTPTATYVAVSAPDPALVSDSEQPGAAAGAAAQVGDQAAWSYLAKLAGRDYISCMTVAGVECSSGWSYPLAIRAIPGGYAFYSESGSTNYLTGPEGNPIVTSGGKETMQIVSSTPDELVLQNDKTTIVYSEWEGQPTSTVIEKGKLQYRSYLVDRSRYANRYAKKFAKIQVAAGKPPITSPYSPTGKAGRTLVAALGPQSPRPSGGGNGGGSDDGSHARSVRKGLGGVLGGVLGTLAGAELTQGMGLTEGIAATLATAAAGALVGSGEISPEDALAATNAVTTGMAQGYADTAAQNARMASVMAEARAADAEYAARQAQNETQTAGAGRTSVGAALLQRERELAAQLAAVREQRAAQEQADEAQRVANGGAVTAAAAGRESKPTSASLDVYLYANMPLQAQGANPKCVSNIFRVDFSYDASDPNARDPAASNAAERYLPRFVGKCNAVGKGSVQGEPKWVIDWRDEGLSAPHINPVDTIVSMP